MKKCECCGQQKQSFPLNDNVCEECCNRLLLGGTSPTHDWSQIDFEKGDFK